MRNGNSHHVPNSLPVEAKFLWTSKTTGPGHSGVAVAEGRVLFADKSAEEANDVWRCLDAKTGKVVWKTPGAGAAYASPIAANVRGQRQVIAYDAESLGGWDIATGERAWKVVPTKPHDYNVATPIALGEQLLVATENNSTRLYGFRGRGYLGPVRIIPTPQRRFDDLAPDMTTPVAYEGMVFCTHNSYLYCLDAKTLKLLWKQRDMAFYSYCSLIAGNGHVLVQAVDGELLLVRASRKAYELVARLRLFEDRKTQVWSHPALVDGRLYIRNQNSINCLQLDSPHAAP